MYLLEHDAKELLAQHRIPIPPGRLVQDGSRIESADLPAGPWVVKGQINAGGRGKAGIIRKAETRDEVAEHARGILGTIVKGRRVNAVRVEQQVAGAEEAYVALLLDEAQARVRVIMSARGGMEIEALPADEIRSETAALEIDALVAAAHRAAGVSAGPKGQALREAGERLARLFIEREAVLVEVNPLFVRADGTWIAGDAKIVTDDNALTRQPDIHALLERRAQAYPEAALKLHHGFDYVVVDPEGEIGLLTTGAGLSMMLIDELRQEGLKPYNFLDVRTGGMRGEPTRLVNVLKWLAEGRRVRIVLINVFAGITDLGEFSRLLVAAMKEVPELKAPVVARLVGNGLPAAREVLREAGIALHTDLGAATREVKALLGGVQR